MKTGKQLFFVPTQFPGFFDHRTVKFSLVGIGLHEFAVFPQTKSGLLYQGHFSDADGKHEAFLVFAPHGFAYSRYKAPKMPQVFAANGSAGQYGHRSLRLESYVFYEGSATIPGAMYLGGFEINRRNFSGLCSKILKKRALLKKKLRSFFIFPNTEQAIYTKVWPYAESVAIATTQHFKKGQTRNFCQASRGKAHLFETPPLLASTGVTKKSNGDNLWIHKVKREK